MWPDDTIDKTRWLIITRQEFNDSLQGVSVVVAVEQVAVSPVHQEEPDALDSSVLRERQSRVVTGGIIRGLDYDQHDFLGLQVCNVKCNHHLCCN